MTLEMRLNTGHSIHSKQKFEKEISAILDMKNGNSCNLSLYFFNKLLSGKYIIHNNLLKHKVKIRLIMQRYLFYNYNVLSC